MSGFGEKGAARFRDVRLWGAGVLGAGMSRRVRAEGFQGVASSRMGGAAFEFDICDLWVQGFVGLALPTSRFLPVEQYELGMGSESESDLHRARRLSRPAGPSSRTPFILNPKPQNLKP